MKEHTSQSPFTTALIAGKLRFIFLHSSQAPFCTLWGKKNNSSSQLSSETSCYMLSFSEGKAENSGR